LGHQRHFRDVRTMSAHPPTADVLLRCRERSKRANNRHPHQFAAHRPGQRCGMPPNFKIELRLLTIAASEQMPAGVAAKWQRATVSEDCSPK